MRAQNNCDAVYRNHVISMIQPTVLNNLRNYLNIIGKYDLYNNHIRFNLWF